MSASKSHLPSIAFWVTCGFGSSRLGERTQGRARGTPGFLRTPIHVRGASGSRQWPSVPGLASGLISRSGASDVASSSCSRFEAVQPPVRPGMDSCQPCISEGPRLCREQNGPDWFQNPASADSSGREAGTARARQAASPKACKPPNRQKGGEAPAA